MKVYVIIRNYLHARKMLISKYKQRFSIFTLNYFFSIVTCTYIDTYKWPEYIFSLTVDHSYLNWDIKNILIILEYW